MRSCITTKVKATFAVFLVYSSLWGGIVDTKHNFSVTGKGVVKATNEQEVCIFCHIPHHSRPLAPLWNHNMPLVNYTMYNSDYLKRMNYQTPTSLGTNFGQPGTLSRQCLSCHDGAVAVGSVYMVRGTVMGNTPIAMSGVDSKGNMLQSQVGYIGDDLTNHHPVGIEYDHTIKKQFGVGVRDMELKVYDANSSAIKLYTYNGKKYVECSSCHDAHTENKKFLRYDGGGSHGANVYRTCTSCHQKKNWAPSIHGTATNVYTDTSVATAYETNSVTSLGCINCHRPHDGEGKPYLLRKAEENTCFQGAGSGDTTTVPCHGRGGAKDIQTSMGKQFGHPTTDPSTQGRHTNLDFIFGTTVPGDGAGGITWSANKHAECVDCHSPHQAKAGNHIDPPDPVNTMFPMVPTNLISKSGPLTGVSGVEPIWPMAGWRKMNGYTTLESATKEYQLCMKCHSSWALDNLANPISNHVIGGRTEDKATDQAWEFNPMNKSAHPVVMSHNQMKLYGGNTLREPSVEGRYADNLQATNLKSPWNLNPGNNTMYCSDCHGADEQTGDPRGPHGSNYKYMLKGRGNYWPYRPNGSLWTIGDTVNDQPDLFCQNCHHTENVDVHKLKAARGLSGYACVKCHVGVPHGSPVSRLMAYNTMPHPYNFAVAGVGQAGANKFRAKGARNYDPGNKGRANVACAGGGGGCHGSVGDGGTYDVYTPTP